LVLSVMGFGSSAIAAAQLPKRFWGEWISIDGSDGGIHMKVSVAAITFGGLRSCKFTNVEVANEESTAFLVNWHCLGDAAGVEIKLGFRLMKIWGKEALVIVNAEDPTSVSVYQRQR